MAVQPHPDFPVYPVDRICSEPGCSNRWTGSSIVKPEAGQLPVPGKCPSCVRQWRRDLVRVTERPRLTIARRVEPTADDDQPHPSRIRRSA
jgi:hypothetical protein